MQSYQYGNLLIEPPEHIFVEVDQLRSQYDSQSSKCPRPHITVTQPFIKPPGPKDIDLIRQICSRFPAFCIHIGPAVASPNQQSIWLKVSPEDQILKLREQLHATGLFNLELPFTTGFIPHMTISEKKRPFANVTSILNDLNLSFEPNDIQVSTLCWSIPDDEFQFSIRESFALKKN